MIYIISGVTRSGKSILTRRLHHKYGIPFFHLDHMMFGMVKAFPDCGFQGDTDDLVKAKILGPMVVGMLEEMHTDGVRDYLVDGVALLPAHVTQLTTHYPSAFKACWLGYPSAQQEQKFTDIRSNTASDDWLNRYPDDYVRKIVAYGIEKSLTLQQQCQNENIRFFDTAQNFETTLQEAETYLLEAIQ